MCNPRSSSFLAVALCACALAGVAGAKTWQVSTSGQLVNAVNGSHGGDEIVIASGTYNVGELWVDTSDLVIRGQSGNRDDVVLVGAGMNDPDWPRIGMHISADDVTLRDLTVSEYYWHAVQLHGGSDRARISNVKTLNIGEQHIKGVKFTRYGVIEYSLMEQTRTRENDGVDRPDNYVGGIDLLGASNWHIHDNVARNIKAIDGGDAGIFLWQDVYDCVIERNVLVGCNKGIGLGNPWNPGNIYHAEDCIVRNNFVLRCYDNDVGVELCYTRNVQVYNNTLQSDVHDHDWFRTLMIYDKTEVPTTNLDLRYNIVGGGVKDFTDGTGWTSTGDITGSVPQAEWFVDPAGGDLHLTELALLAIDAAGLLSEVPEDIDGILRGDLPDVGADEFRFPGDANGDNRVDYLDLGLLASHYNTSQANWAEGDFNGDGMVTYEDLGLLAGFYGRALGKGSPPTPEPASILLLSAAAAVLLRRRRP